MVKQASDFWEQWPSICPPDATVCVLFVCMLCSVRACVRACMRVCVLMPVCMCARAPALQCGEFGVASERWMSPWEIRLGVRHFET